MLLVALVCFSVHSLFAQSASPSTKTTVVSEVIEEIPVRLVEADAAAMLRLREEFTPIRPTSPEILELERQCVYAPELYQAIQSKKITSLDQIPDSLHRRLCSLYQKMANQETKSRHSGKVYILISNTTSLSEKPNIIGAVLLPIISQWQAENVDAYLSLLSSTPLTQGFLSVEDLRRISTKRFVMLGQDTSHLLGSITSTPHKTMYEYVEAMVAIYLQELSVKIRGTALKSTSGKIIGLTGLQMLNGSVKTLTDVTLLQAPPELARFCNETLQNVPQKTARILQAERECTRCKEIQMTIERGHFIPDSLLVANLLPCMAVASYYKAVQEYTPIESVFVVTSNAATPGAPPLLGVVGVNMTKYCHAAQQDFSVSPICLEGLQTSLSNGMISRGVLSAKELQGFSTRDSSMKSALQTPFATVYEYLADALQRNKLAPVCTARGVKYSERVEKFMKYIDIQLLR